MKILRKTLPLMTAGLLSVSLSGCMDEVTPINSVTPEQLAGMTSSQEALLGGIVSFTNDYNTYGGTGDYANYLNDWGYPCQMFYRDVLTADFPLDEGSSYTYWMYAEQSSLLTSEATYTYNYYYHFVKNCNNLITVIDPETANTSSLRYLGCALVFRALCYLDMARLFEFQPTGYSTLDAKAADVWGLTVPIVDEDITETEMRNNPRAPFYTMYRFIHNDLAKAEVYLNGYTRPNGNYPDLSVVYGIMARFWLELGTRFDKTPADLTTQVSHESDEDGYASLGITSANDCFEKAAEYARLAQSGYTPLTQAEWTASTTGFNTATNAWMFYSSISTQEQEGYYYSSWMGSLCTEATWAMPQIGNCYREIGSWLYNQIGENDWRKVSWIAPEDAGKEPNAKYNIKVWSSTDATSGTVTTSSDKFKNFPAYTNLKYRARDISDYIEGMKCDIPMMRVEEMYFIEAEAVAHTDGWSAGAQKLQEFMTNYRYSSGSYTSTATDLDSFTDELIAQKRIEFWGEGLTFFDLKRLKMAVKRTASTNYASAYQQDSKDGYVSPTMNLFISTYAKNQNTGLVLNPDCTGWDELE